MRLVLAHWDEAEGGRAELGHLGGAWTDLGTAAGSRTVGVKRVQIDPGKWSTPAHRQTAEEEICFVLGGFGLSWQDGKTYEVRDGDCIVHLAAAELHTLKAGPDGLDVLLFGERRRTEIGHLPRAGVAWIGRTWADVGAGEHPWEREVAAGEPETSKPSERPPNITREDDVESAFGGRVFSLAQAAGSKRTGLNLTRLGAAEEGAPPHCHSAEEELFVVLDGDGTLRLEPTPARRSLGARDEEHSVRRGHVVSQPAGNGICHSFEAGDRGLVYLAYGTREPNDIVYYPRESTVFLKGVGVDLPVGKQKIFSE